MASTISPPILRPLSLHRGCNALPTSCKTHIRMPAPTLFTSRRNLLFFITAAPILITRESASLAQDIGLFGLRKSLRKAEEQTEELVKEGFETAEKGLETAERGLKTAEKGLETAEKEIEFAEKEIEGALGFGGLAQAGAVAGAEFVGVVVATSIVNGILGPEAQKS